MARIVSDAFSLSHFVTIAIKNGVLPELDGAIDEVLSR